MNLTLGRRNFFGTVRNPLTAGGILGQFRPLDAAAATTGERGEDYYDKLGVTKIINAAGTYTIAHRVHHAALRSGGGRARPRNIRSACSSCRRQPENTWRASCKCEGGAGDGRRRLRPDAGNRRMRHGGQQVRRFATSPPKSRT